MISVCCSPIMWAALKVTPLILFFWLMTSEAAAGGMAVEVKPSCQYATAFCCHVTDSSRGAVWQNAIWHGGSSEAKFCQWIPPCGKKWYSTTLGEHFWRPNSGCEHSEVVNNAFQQWWQWSERQAMFWMAMHICHTMKWRVSQSAYPYKSADCNQRTLYGA